ncbi:MAG: N-acetylglucosamine kinase [Oscillospiraceae bacterium]|nr:N-acetylglucosamine kinase [Oscillospiraceae bacterium]
MSKKKYIIGVDGGNTKTDYFLFDTGGNFIDHIKDGTCSHEHVGYKKAEEILNANIDALTGRNNITRSEIAAGVFGLAGIDTKPQLREFVKIMDRMGFVYAVDNDSFLGIVAGTTKGYGICSINGTGTVSGGIDPHGGRHQTGGLGMLTGDDAGGVYIAHLCARLVYDSFFRCGEPTVMAEAVFSFLGITDPDDLMQAYCEAGQKLASTKMARIVFDAAAENDKAALEALDSSAKQLAKTSAGCARSLNFDAEIEIVLAGSVWVKAECPVLVEGYKKYMAELLPDKTLKYNILRVPPATGAVLWALSLTGIDPFTEPTRQKVIKAVEERLVYN